MHPSGAGQVQIPALPSGWRATASPSAQQSGQGQLHTQQESIPTQCPQHRLCVSPRLPWPYRWLESPMPERCACKSSLEATPAPSEHSPSVSCLQIHGSQDFHICVRDMIPTDIPEHFRGTVSIWAAVTTTDGSQQVAFDDSTPVQKQLVDIRYSKATRKQFKPGLSYAGMVSAGASRGRPRSQALPCLHPDSCLRATEKPIAAGAAKPAGPDVTWPVPDPFLYPPPVPLRPLAFPSHPQDGGGLSSHCVPLLLHVGTALLSLCQDLCLRVPCMETWLLCPLIAGSRLEEKLKYHMRGQNMHAEGAGGVHSGPGEHFTCSWEIAPHLG